METDERYTDEQLVAHINELRKYSFAAKEHPLDRVIVELRNSSTAAQRKRIWGCTDVKQAAGRATHGDAFRF